LTPEPDLPASANRTQAAPIAAPNLDRPGNISSARDSSRDRNRSGDSDSHRNSDSNSTVSRGRTWPLSAAALWVLGAALLAVAIAVWQLEKASQGLSISRLQLGSTPVTVFRPSPATAADSAAAAAGVRQPAPVVLIAHGFAGSQQLMQPLAQTLARNGFVAITFDFPGHGRNTAPMQGGLSDQEQSLRTLLASMQQMGGFASEWATGASAGNVGNDSNSDSNNSSNNSTNNNENSSNRGSNNNNDGNSINKNGRGRYAVVGHSMASDIVVRHAQTNPEVLASVGVSLFAPSIKADTPADSPRNLLVISGAWEPAMMAAEALRVVGRATEVQPRADTTYGRFEDGTARRATQAAGVEHIGVLYSADTLHQTLAWLNTAFGRPPAREPFIDSRGPWLGLLMLGVVALAWPLSQLLPVLRPQRPTTQSQVQLQALPQDQSQVRPQDQSQARPQVQAQLQPQLQPQIQSPLRLPRLRRWRWRGQAPVTLLPALLTPLLLWKLPSDFLPLLLGDYLVLHFALYGLLTMAGLWWLGKRPAPIAPAQRAALALAVLLASGYALLAVGVPIDRYVFNVQPHSLRLPLMAVLCAGTLPYFWADEWLTREGLAPDAAPPHAAYFFSKLCFLLSLVAAIALNPGRLFFLALIVPAVLLLFVVYGLFSRWAFKRTGLAAVGATANALAFGCFIGATFPVVA